MPLSATVARVVSAEDPTIPINDSKEINGEQGISPEVESDFPDGGLRAWLIVFGVSAKAPLHRFLFSWKFTTDDVQYVCDVSGISMTLFIRGNLTPGIGLVMSTHGVWVNSFSGIQFSQSQLYSRSSKRITNKTHCIILHRPTCKALLLALTCIHLLYCPVSSAWIGSVQVCSTYLICLMKSESSSVFLGFLTWIDNRTVIWSRIFQGSLLHCQYTSRPGNLPCRAMHRVLAISSLSGLCHWSS